MESTAPFNRHRGAFLDQYRRLEIAVRRSLIDADAEIATYDAALSEQHFVGDEPSYQEGEYKAELLAMFEDQARSAQADMAAFGVAALYHRWESSVKWLIERTNRPHTVPGLQRANFSKLKSLLKFDSLPPNCRDTFNSIDLGRLIANVIKHGEGDAAKCLRERDSRFFKCPWTDANFPLPSAHGVNLIWVGPEDLDAVSCAIRRFWETLPDCHFPPTPPLTLEALAAPDFE